MKDKTVEVKAVEQWGNAVTIFTIQVGDMVDRVPDETLLTYIREDYDIVMPEEYGEYHNLNYLELVVETDDEGKDVVYVIKHNTYIENEEVVNDMEGTEIKTYKSEKAAINYAKRNNMVIAATTYL